MASFLVHHATRPVRLASLRTHINASRRAAAASFKTASGHYSTSSAKGHSPRAPFQSRYTSRNFALGLAIIIGAGLALQAPLQLEAAPSLPDDDLVVQSAEMESELLSTRIKVVC